MHETLKLPFFDNNLEILDPSKLLLFLHEFQGMNHHISLCPINELINYRVNITYKTDGNNGDLGEAESFYFDLKSWEVRFLVVKTAPGLNQAHLMIHKSSISEVQIESRRIFVSIKPAAIREYKGVDIGDSNHSIQPFSRLRQYRINIGGDRFGRLEDFLCDKETLKVHFLILRTQRWWPFPLVLLPLEWVEWANQDSKEIRVISSKEITKRGPRYSRLSGVNDKYRKEIYDYYNSHVSTIVRVA